MVIGKIKPTATIVAQFAAGVEVEAIQHEGKMYMPVVGMGEFAATDDGSGKPARTAEPKPSKKEDDGATTTEGKKYSEDELMEMSTKDLLKMCKDMGIDPDKSEGKNTNKKLRLLILEAQDGAGDADENDAEEGDELTNSVSEILEDFDGGKKNKKKTLSALIDLAEDDDVEDDDVSELLEKFEDDADADIDETAAAIAAILRGEKPAKKGKKDKVKDEKPAKKGAKKSKKDEDEDEDEDLVEVEDLEVGDRVSVWWDDDNKDWFDGEVKSISKKGKVVIAYDDDTEEAIDPEVHTKIKRLED